MNESCWICLACLPACLSSAEAGFCRRATLHWHRAESRPICTTTVHTLGTNTEPHSTGSYSSDTTSTEKNQGEGSPGFLHHQGGGTQQLRKGPGVTILGTNCYLNQIPLHLTPILNTTTTTTTPPLSLLPMPLSSAAPFTSLASIWIEAPCFSSYKSR